MTELTTDKELLQWHGAFYAGIQIELEKEASKLIFENEHQLSTKPMEIDVLIIKKYGDAPIKKNIGKIFCKYNVIEYKSPGDYLSINDFYKVYAYCCFYKADTLIADFIKVNELTISFVCSHYPQKLFQHLKKIRGYKIIQKAQGIYYICGDIFPMQIIVTTRLAKEENLWLKSLSDRLEKEDILDGLLDSYKVNYKNPLYESVMDIIIRANQQVFKEEIDVCEALEELMKDKMEEKVEIGKEIGKEIGENRVNELTKILSRAGRFDDIIKAAEDKEYQKLLFEEFALQE